MKPVGRRYQDQDYWEWSLPVDRENPDGRRRRPAALYLILIPMVWLAAIGVIAAFKVPAASAHPLPGAIFTTLPDGSVVNGNIYSSKCDVALNGGPSSQQAHHLPDGVYDVAVTDPSGKTVLGAGYGVVVISAGGGTFGPTSLCDLVFPSPYGTTPNHGGEYKAWLCLSGQMFVNHDCKTDNFKVRPQNTPTPTAAATPTPTPTPTPATTPAPTPTPIVAGTSSPPSDATPTPTPIVAGTSSPPADATPTPTPIVAGTSSPPAGATNTPAPAPTVLAQAKTPTPVALDASSSPAVRSLPNGGSSVVSAGRSAFLVLTLIGFFAALAGLVASSRSRKVR